MSDRGSFRNRDQRGSNRGSHQGGSRGSHSHHHPHDRPGTSTSTTTTAPSDRPKKDPILDLSKYADKKIIVKFSGGRQIQGTLKGFDQLMNLVLDDVEEMLRDDAGNTSTRALGLLVARGTLLTSISPADGSEEIVNPFAGAEEEEEEEEEN